MSTIKLDSKQEKAALKWRKGADVPASQVASLLQVLPGFEVSSFRIGRDKQWRFKSRGDVLEFEASRARLSNYVQQDKADGVWRVGEWGEGVSMVAWLNARGLIEACCEALGLPTVEGEKAAKLADKLLREHRVTCQCCFGHFRTHEVGKQAALEGRLATLRGVMVDHGYTLSDGRCGWRSGSCIGVGEAPYERSCEATKRMLKLAEDFIAAQTEVIDRLKAQTSITHRVPAPGAKRVYNHRTGRREWEPMIEETLSATGKDAWKFREVLARRVHKVEWQLRQAQGDRDLLARKVATWKLDPMLADDVKPAPVERQVTVQLQVTSTLDEATLLRIVKASVAALQLRTVVRGEDSEAIVSDPAVVIATTLPGTGTPPAR